MSKHPYPHQTANHDASIQTWHYGDLVCVEAVIGELATFSLDLDAETAWNLARDIAKAARKASPELIGALEARP